MERCLELHPECICNRCEKNLVTAHGVRCCFVAEGGKCWEGKGCAIRECPEFKIKKPLPGVEDPETASQNWTVQV